MFRDLLLPFGVALGMGLLIGFQRERTKGALGGVRTFPLIALAGALCGHLDRRLEGAWIVPTGLLVLAAMVVTANLTARRREQGERRLGSGITTEVAALVVFLVGVLAVVGSLPLTVVIGGIVVVLLHLKRPMHAATERLTDDEVRALMRIVVIGLVILPALPDRTYGPYDVLNPFRIWLMVVLIVGISVVSYVLYRLVGARAGTILGGVLGGLISSTATTASYARRAGDDPGFASPAAAVLMVASTVVFARIFLEVGAVAPTLLPAIAAPLCAMAAVNVVLSAIGIARARHPSGSPAPDDPGGLGAALVFGALYGAILFAVAAAKEHLGDVGLFGVAAVSGLTDVDAITLSVANLAEAGRVDADTAWRAILLAALANLVLKGGLAFALGGRRLMRPVALLFGPSIGVGAGILVVWP